MIGAMKLDNRDLQILTILQAEGRITKSELAARVSLSPAACWDRLKRLDQAGFIRGYHAEVALEKIAPASQFLVQIELESHQTRSEEHTSELQSLMRISYAVFCLKKQKKISENTQPKRQNLCSVCQITNH